MSKKTINVGLIIAIIFASVAISGSLVFFGMTQFQEKTQVNVFDEELLATKIEEGIENYVEVQVEEQQESQKAQVEESAKEANEKAKQVKKVSKTDDHIRGNPDAKISLIEYSDFECPFCKRFHPTAQEVIDIYDGEVNWVYRHFPLSFHDPLATQEAQASECANELAGNDAFWKYTDLIFERTNSNGQGLEIDSLISMATEIGLDEANFKECFESEKYADHIKQDTADGVKAGVTGTPGNIIINNETGDVKLIPGAQPATVFQEAIDQML